MNIERDYPINALDDNVVANEAQGVSKKVAGQRLTMILIRQWTVKTGKRFMVFIYKILHSDGLQVCFQGITHFISLFLNTGKFGKCQITNYAISNILPSL